MSIARQPAGPSGPAGTLDPTSAETPPPAVRSFGTGLRVGCHGGGRWVATVAGERFEIERRRAEPGCPAGWWNFGPDASGGTWAGDDAAALADQRAGRRSAP